MSLTMTILNDKPDLLTIEEVAAILRVDDTTVRRWIEKKALEAVTLPTYGRRRTRRVRKDTIAALLSDVSA